MSRPGKLCKLQSGKAIGAQIHEQFAATFNWLVDCMKHIKGGKGIEAKWVNDDTLEISATTPTQDAEDGFVGGNSSGCFAYSDGNIINCHFKLGRNGEVITLPDQAAGDGTWYLTIIHSNP